MNNNGIIIALLAILIMVGIYMIVDKKDTQPQVVRVERDDNSADRAERADNPANNDGTVEFKMNRKVKI